MLDEMPISLKAPNEQEKNLSKLKREISALEALHNGTFALNPLFDSEESKKQKQQELLNYFASSVSKMGYKPKVMQERGGGLKFGVEIDGAVHDVTPSFLDALARNGLEIGLSLASIAAIPFTGGASLAGLGAAAAGAGARAAAGSAARAALGSAVGKGFAYGVAGSAAGAGGDYLINSKIAGETPSALGTTKAILGGAGNEALGVGIGEAIMKAVQSVPRFSGKVIDYTPVIGAIRKQNINGALRELEKQIGSKEKTLELLALAQKRGTELESSSRSQMLDIAKGLLDSQKSNKYEPIRKLAGYGKLGVEASEKFLFSPEVNKGHNKILTLARSNPRLAEMLGSIVKSEPKAAENLKNIINTDRQRLFSELERLRGDKPGIRAAAKEYVINTKRGFGEMLEELERVYEGKGAKLTEGRRFTELLEDLQTIKEEAWGANFPPRLKGLWQQLELERELSIKDINRLRIELNRVIENSNFFEAREAARRTKNYLEGDVLESILEKLPLAERAKNLYKESVAEYKAMKRIEESRWYKNRVENPDIGNEALVNKALKVFLESAENTVEKSSSVNELLMRISPKNRAGIELEFIERVLKNSELVGEEVRAFDLKEALGTLKGVQFQSAEARGFNELLGELERLIGNDSTIAKSIGGFKEQKKLSQGISQDPMARLATQKANFIIKNAFRLFPIIGDQPALLHHLSIAAQSAKSYTGFRAHLEHIAKSPDLERGIRANLRAFLRSAEEFESEAKRAEIEYKRGDDGNGSDGFSGGNNPNGGSNPRGGGDSGGNPGDGGSGVVNPSGIVTRESLLERLSDIEFLNNPKGKVFTQKIEGEELAQLQKEFNFKGSFDLVREIRSRSVKHILNEHGDELKELQRGQKAITLEDIANYQDFIKDPTLRAVRDNRIIYAKQINGHYVVIEEALRKTNRVSLVTMWKGKGKINKEVLLPHRQRPKTDSRPNSSHDMHSNTMGIPEGSIAQKEPRSLSEELQNSSQKPLEAFGKNFPEFYHDGKGAVEKLLKERNGQVAGAFYRDDLGDIDLVWGNEKFGLRHIVEKHPEVTPEALEHIIKNGEATFKQNEAIRIEKDGYKVILKSNWNGEKLNNNWVVTAYELEQPLSISSKGFTAADSLATNSKKPPHSEFRPSSDLEQSGVNLPASGKSAPSLEELGESIAPKELNSPTQESIEESWSKIFNLKSNDEAWRPNLPSELKEKLGDEIELPRDFLASFNRTFFGESVARYLPIIKETMENPSVVFRDKRLLVFAKEHEGKMYAIKLSEKDEPRLKTLTLDERGIELLKARLENRQIIYQSPSFRLLFDKRSPKKDRAKSSLKELEPSAVKEESKGAQAESKEPLEQITEKSTNFHTTEPREYGGEKTRLNENIKALEILRSKSADELHTKEEQEILARYNGWGGLSKYLEEGTKESARVRELLGKEYESAFLSTTDSFYTPQKVVQAIWNKLEASGVKGGDILEPSMGVGNFFALMPREIAKSSRLHGVELDNITHDIAQRLYPQANITHGDFRDFRLQSGADLVVENPPYGDLRIHDKSNKELNGHMIHNYFVLKSLDLTKENGINVAVVTSNLLDSSSARFKEALAKRAELLGAIRLPNSTFKDTSVTTDILFLRKKGASEAPDELLGAKVVSIKGDDGSTIEIHPYFAEHKEQILGDIGLLSGMNGRKALGVSLKEGNLDELLEGALGRIEFRAQETLAPLAQKSSETLEPALEIPYLKNGSTFYRDGELYKRDAHGDRKVEGYEFLNLDREISSYKEATLIGKAKKAKEIIKSIEPLRESLFRLKSLEMDSAASEAAIGSERARLNRLYDEFKGKHGYLSDNEIARLYKDDPTYAHLSALEKDYKSFEVEGKRVKRAQKADIFTKRTLFPYVEPTSARNTKEALEISFAQTGGVDTQYMAKLLKKEESDVAKELLESKEAFRDSRGEIVAKDEFLSGDIAEKIKSFQGKELSASQKEALSELEKTLPKRLEVDDIHFSLGSPWIPKEVYLRFEKEVLGLHPNKLGGASEYSTLQGWRVDTDFLAPYDVNILYGVEGQYKRVSPSEIYEAALNNRHISMSVKKDKVLHRDTQGDIAVSSAIERMKNRFLEFVLGDSELSKLLSAEYNARFNNYIDRKFSGGATRLKGQSSLIELKPHQANAIKRIIATPNTLLDHTVGTGKSFTMIGAAMELRRLGIAKKPLIAVPKALLEQFSGEFMKLFPNANILTPREFTPKNRRKVLASIATNDYDGVIITHEYLKNIELSPKFHQKLINEEIAQIEEAQRKSGKRGKELAGMLKKAKEKLLKLNAKKRSKDEIYFEDLGVDALFVDEAHKFKNLRFFTNMQKVKGLGNVEGSERANDMFNKVRFIQERGGKIVFATGTPLSNSLAELYTLQRYLAPERLKALGENSFDEWISANARIINDFEPNAAGGYNEASTLKEIGNVTELQREYKGFADVITNKTMEQQLKEAGRENILPPKVAQENIYLKPSGEIKALYNDLARRHEEVLANPKAYQKGESVGDHMFKIIHDAKNAALDMRLINEAYGDYAGSKANAVVKNTLQIYQDTQKVKGTQLVFLDSSTPKSGEHFNLYGDIKNKLIEAGVKKEEIAFIHDYDNQREKLYKAINNGDIRIILGSTEKMGTGLNVQERLAGIHEIDIPIKPDAMLQRRGRIERGGNLISELIPGYTPKIFTYIMEGTSDIYHLSALARKAKMSDDLRTGNLTGRTLRGDDSLSEEMLETFVVASGNNDLRRKSELDKIIRELRSEEANYLNKTRRRNQELEIHKKAIEELPLVIENIKEDIKALKAHKKGDELIEIKGNHFNKEQKQKALSEILYKMNYNHPGDPLGSYRGFDFMVEFREHGVVFSLQGKESYELPVLAYQEISTGIFTRLENLLKSLPERIKTHESTLANAQTRLKELEGTSAPSFSKKEELESAQKELGEVIARLKEHRENQGTVMQSNALVLAPLLGFIPVGDDEFILENQSSVLVLLGLGLGSLAGRKISGERLKKLADALPKGALESLARVLKQKEQRGIYNVTFNEKKSSRIYKDLEVVEDFLKYEKGAEDIAKGKGFGAMHIQKHLDKNRGGWVSKEELLNLGEIMRNAQEKEIKGSKSVYTYFNDEGVRFRVVIGKREGKKGQLEKVITFYSDRRAER